MVLKFLSKRNPEIIANTAFRSRAAHFFGSDLRRPRPEKIDEEEEEIFARMQDDCRDQDYITVMKSKLYEQELTENNRPLQFGTLDI
ncbi:Uncharacterized protein HZ326_25356 [Fusarium oxysporum f. sp. albedinis]|nr:Uncharacterized protein HZ326_25356 [Fusarium oxysporum f. sp. albedinis]